MNDGTRVMRGPRRAWPPVARTAAAIIARRPGPAGGMQRQPVIHRFRRLTERGGQRAPRQRSPTPTACARTACRTSPTPPATGQCPKASAQQFGVSSSQLKAAQTACQHLLPGNGGSAEATMDSRRQCEVTGDCPQALVQQA